MAEKKSLEGRTVLVTGGDKGIGSGVVRAMAEAGAAVGVNYAHDRDSAQEIVAGIVEKGGKARAFQADVSSEEQVEAMFGAFAEAFGPLDVLVSNAGMQRDSAFADMSLDDWNRVVGVNLTGGFLCARAAARAFLGREDAGAVRKARKGVVGTIIFMSSVHEVIPWAGHANYAATKGGLSMLMKSVAQELAGQGIRALNIAPGAIKTSINKKVWDDPDGARELMGLIPLGRIGEPADIGPVAAWLASDEAAYVTGVTLYVDGGMLLYPGFRTGG